MERMSHSELEPLRAFIAADRQKPVGAFEKSIPARFAEQSIEEVVADAPYLSVFSTPVLTLDQHRLRENIRVMAEWCAQRGVLLCPHGKTTMSPALWYEQLAAGAWGITVGNEAQLRVALLSGVPRVMLANLLLREAGLVWLGQYLADNPAQSVLTWVDSIEAVRAMERGLAGVAKPLPVLVEIGEYGGRTGARSVQDAVAVAEAVASSAQLTLAGVTGYEGVITHGTEPEDLKLLDAFFEKIRETHEAIVAKYQVARPIISAGGSAYFDRVVSKFADLSDVDIVLRSGATIAHDDGIYVDMTPSKTRIGPRLGAALNVWGRVISRPEAGIAYLDTGRRDVPDDEGLPVVSDTRSGGAVVAAPGATVTALNDQHAHLRLETGVQLAVGDVVRLGVSHPCTTFDKWSTVLIVDDASAVDPRVVDIVRTRF